MNEEVVPIAEAATEFEAQVKAEVLRSVGIEATVAAGSARPDIGAAGIRSPLDGAPCNSVVCVLAEDVDRARAALAEAGSVDWDTLDVGERVDGLPLHPHGRRPLLFRVGWVTACVILVASLLALITALVV